MEAVEQPQNAEDLRLLLNWDTEGDDARHRRAAIVSIAFHLIALMVLLLLPHEVFRSPVETRRVTPLIAPPPELTQNTPNRGKISKEFNIQAVKPRPRIQIPPSPPSKTRPKAPVLSAPEPKASPPAALPEPPKIDFAK
ncbi:MAG: TonB family protein, partial [Bryobacterales bacterium]|nr:TonB family protein [Bryobacterales bacterium]